MEPRLDDPDFEPTDEQLRDLARRAFADVPRARAAAQDRIRREIGAAREAALQRFRDASDERATR